MKKQTQEMHSNKIIKSRTQDAMEISRIDFFIMKTIPNIN